MMLSAVGRVEQIAAAGNRTYRTRRSKHGNMVIGGSEGVAGQFI
jgi:hypothetical protein